MHFRSVISFLLHLNLRLSFYSGNKYSNQDVPKPLKVKFIDTLQLRLDVLKFSFVQSIVIVKICL